MKIGRSVWLASRIKKLNAEISEYDTPTEIITRPNYFTVMPATARGYIAVMEYGERVSQVWTAIANSAVFYGKIKAGDVMWVDGASPNEEIENKFGVGASANAVVKNVVEVNRTLSITLEKNQNQL